MQVGEESEWTKVEATVDSGSAEHVLPAGWFAKVPMEESTGSRAGEQYLAASGEKVPNMGEKTIKAMTNEGMKLSVVFQVTRVVKPLLSAAKMTRQGHRVVLDGHRPCIVSRGGASRPSEWRQRVYVVDLWVHSNLGATPGFPRQ